MTKKSKSGHQARSVARLAAVQALYQMETGGAGVEAVIREFEDHRFDRDIDGAVRGHENANRRFRARQRPGNKIHPVLAAEPEIGEQDIALLSVTDSVQEAVEIILASAVNGNGNHR